MNIDAYEISGTIGTWSIETGVLPEALQCSQAVVTSSMVYLLGGQSSNDIVKSIYSAPIDSNGTIGAWSIEPNTLSGTLAYSQAVVTSSRVYLLGGIGNGTGTNKVYSAPINTNGTIGTWSIDAIVLPETLELSQTVVTSSRVYLLGGISNGTTNGRIYSTVINSNGALGEWLVEPNTLPEVSQRSQAVVTSSRVYLLGGINDRGATNKIYSAPIKSNGTLGTWSSATNILPEALFGSQAVVTNGKVYLLGGYVSNSVTNKVYSAPIDSNGTIGAWSIEPNTLPEGLCDSQIAVTSSRVYLLGGYIGTSCPDKIYSAPLLEG